MNRHIRLFLSLAALLMLLLVAVSGPAGADGIPVELDSSFFDLEMPAQKAILVYDEQSQREDLILSIELKGGPEAGWVVPVPWLPEVETASGPKASTRLPQELFWRSEDWSCLLIGGKNEAAEALLLPFITLPTHVIACADSR